jgi:phosphoglycolate phosphatase
MDQRPALAELTTRPAELKHLTLDLLIFDIDGTLLSSRVSRAAFETVFDRLFGVVHACDGISFVGNTDPLIVSLAARRALGRELNPAEVERLYSEYVTAFGEALEGTGGIAPFPDVIPALDELRKDGTKLLGVQTGNIEAAARLKLEAARLQHYFSFGAFASDSPERAQIAAVAAARGEKQLGEPAKRITVIGDAVSDVLAGRAIGAVTVALTRRPELLSELERACPDHLVPDLSYLGRVL